MLNIEVIDGYFQNHPLRSQYLAYSAAERAGAAAVAESDVSAALDHTPVPEAHSAVVLAAVAEQTLFLLLNPVHLTGGADALASESSAGERRSYRERRSPLCLRSAALIAPLRDRGAALKLNRG